MPSGPLPGYGHPSSSLSAARGAPASLRSPHWTEVVPFAPVLAGLVLSSWRFRTEDPIGGLAFALGGVMLMIVLAAWLPDSRRR